MALHSEFEIESNLEKSIKLYLENFKYFGSFKSILLLISLIKVTLKDGIWKKANDK